MKLYSNFKAKAKNWLIRKVQSKIRIINHELHKLGRRMENLKKQNNNKQTKYMFIDSSIKYKIDELEKRKILLVYQEKRLYEWLERFKGW